MGHDCVGAGVGDHEGCGAVQALHSADGGNRWLFFEELDGLDPDCSPLGGHCCFVTLSVGEAL